jgi:hypothetical protein
MANQVLTKLICDNQLLILRHHAGEIQYGDTCYRYSKDLIESVCDQIIYDIIGIHPQFGGSFHCEYDVTCEPLRIEVHFWESATHTAEQICLAFRKLADVPLLVVVTAKSSEFESL